MMKNITDEFLSRTVQKMLKNSSVFGAVFCVEDREGLFSWTGSAGNIKKNDRYFIASVTKLYVTAVMVMLREQGKISFDDKVYTFFPESYIDGIHVLDGRDYTKEITISHLMSNTSGLPDYFYYEKPKGEAASSLLGKDQSWPLDRVIDKVRGMKPKFVPGRKGKVFYSDTNYQLLGGIIESVTGLPAGEAFKTFLFDPLNLKDTYAFKDEQDTTPVPIYFKKEQVHAPKYLASVTAEGGIVSTAGESMVFLKAFFSGRFFPEKILDELQTNWNMILFPGQFYFGLGLEKLWTPRILSPLKPVGDILGFWGQTGAFAFHHPDSGLFFTGTINQTSGFGHSAAFKAVLKVIKQVI